MFSTFIEFLKSIQNNDIEKFNQLFLQVNPHDYQNVAFKVAYKTLLTNNYNIEIVKNLVNLNEPQTWFDELMQYARHKVHVQEFLMDMWNLGVKGVHPLSNLIEDAGYNSDLFEFLIKNNAQIKPEEEEFIIDFIDVREYEVMKKYNYQLTLNADFHEKIKQKIGLLEFTPKTIEKIKNADLDDIYFILSDYYIEKLGLEKVETIFRLIENKEKAQNFFRQKFNLNSDINLSTIKLIHQYFDILPTYFRFHYIIHIDTALYFLDKNEFNEQNFKNFLASIEKFEFKDKPNEINQLITPYLERFKDKNLDSLIFNEKNEVRFTNWNQYTKSQKAFKNIDNLAYIKNLKNIDSPELFLRATQDVKLFLAHYVQITPLICEKIYDNEVFEILLKHNAPFKKCSIENIEVLKNYPELDLSETELCFKNQKLNMEQTKWVKKLYLKNKIKLDDALIHNILINQYKETQLKKIIEKDIENQFRFSFSHLTLSSDLCLFIINHTNNHMGTPSIKNYEDIKKWLDIENFKSIMIIEALKMGYFDLLTKEDIDKGFEKNLYHFQFKQISDKYMDYLNHFGINHIELYWALAHHETQFLETMQIYQEHKQFDHSFNQTIKINKVKKL